MKSLLLAPIGYYVGKHIQLVDETPLIASYTMETTPDLMQAMGMNAEEELTAILAKQITAEIDQEILRSLQCHTM